MGHIDFGKADSEKWMLILASIFNILGSVLVNFVLPTS